MILNKVAEVTKWRLLSDFSLPIALIVGMATVILYVQVV